MLQNEICNLTYFYEKDEKKHDIMACVLFKIRKSYKDFSIYRDGFYYLLEKKNQDLLEKNHIKFRIYIDKSLETVEDPSFHQALDEVKRNPNFQIIQYECGEYLDSTNSIYHRSFFPTMVRFLPFINFEDNDSNYVFVTDIDFTETSKNTNYLEFIINVFNKLREKEIDYLYNNILCYHPFWGTEMKRAFQKFVMAGFFFGKCKMDPASYIQFMRDVQLRTKSPDPFIRNFFEIYDQYIQKISKKKNINLRLQKKSITYELDKVFVYGIDEFYLTYYLLIEILKSPQNLKVYEYIRNAAAGGFGRLLTQLFDPILAKKVRLTPAAISLYRTLFQQIISDIPANSRHEDQMALDRFLQHSSIQNQNEVAEMIQLFIQLISPHDYDNKMNIKVPLYQSFYRHFTEIYHSKNGKLLALSRDREVVRCFLQNDNYYTDHNNLIQLDETEKNKIYQSYLQDRNRLLAIYEPKSKSHSKSKSKSKSKSHSKSKSKSKSKSHSK